jgi:hypothetical protein
LEQPELSEVRNCVSGFSHELAVPLFKLVLFFNAAFCRRYQLRSGLKAHRLNSVFLEPCEKEAIIGFHPAEPAGGLSTADVHDA